MPTFPTLYISFWYEGRTMTVYTDEVTCLQAYQKLDRYIQGDTVIFKHIHNGTEYEDEFYNGLERANQLGIPYTPEYEDEDEEYEEEEEEE